MLYPRTALPFVLVLASVYMLTAVPASAKPKNPKPGTYSFNFRGESAFTVGTGTCGTGTCLTYNGSQSVDMPAIGNNLTFNWTLNQGEKLSTQPDGGSCYSADGSGTIANGSIPDFRVDLGGGVLCTNDDDSDAYLKFSTALTGEGPWSGVDGVMDLSAILNFIDALSNIEGDGNFTISQHSM